MQAPSIGGIVIGFVALAGVFRLLELRRPRGRRMPMLRAGFATDLGYWALIPYVTHYVVGAALILALVPLALLIHGRIDEATVMAGFGPLSRLPYPVQALAMLVLADFLGYWMHRLFHGRRLWRFHAVHHSSTALDWLSSVRVHPVNEAVTRAAITLPLVGLGFAPAAAVWVGPAFALFGLLLHANVDWDWGRFRTVLASPRFHRWHHSAEPEARDCNFAGLLPLWDLLFGTYYMPADRLPERFGSETPVPEGLLAQMAFPFRKAARG